jgi:hypothetical protein
MTTRYEFGYGYGEIYRRRMQAQDEMHRQAEKRRGRLPEEDRERMRYESDYYGFRGAGSRGSYATEYPVQSRSGGRMRDGGASKKRPSTPRKRHRR